MKRTDLLHKIVCLALISGLLAACTGKAPEPAETSPAAVQESTSAAAQLPAGQAQESSGGADQSGTAETGAAEQSGTEETAAPAAPALKLPDYTFTFANFPRMDGSTATVPLAKTLAGTLLGVDPAETEELCRFNRTTQSFRNLLEGEADILIVGEPKADVYKEMDDAGFGYEVEEIATDALIFVVNEENPVDSLTTEQIRDIYTGRITNWKEVGGNDAPIIPFQRNEGAGSQALMVKLVMNGEPFMKAPQEYVSTSMGDLMTAVKSYDNSANAIGYSVYYYANDMKMAKGLKIIAVDGTDPDPETIRARKYPHLNAYYCVIPKEKTQEGARVIYDWLMTEDGQRLIAGEGYVSVMDVSALTGIGSTAGGVPAAVYTRLDDAPEGSLTELKARSDYGTLYPYNGSELYEEYYGAYDEDESYVDFPSGYMKGFFDAKGRLVTDPVFNDIEVLSYYDARDNREHSLPMYRAMRYDMAKTDGEYYDEDAVKIQLVSADGRFVSETLGYAAGMEGHVLCKKDYYSNDFVIYDLKGRKVLDFNKLLQANDWLKRHTEEEGLIYDVEYGEGLFCFYIGCSYYYADPATGEIVLGPYGYAQPFRNGRALVRTQDDRLAEIIDKKGNEILDAVYDQADILPNGSIIACDGMKVSLFDAEGKRLARIWDAENYTTTNWGFVVTKTGEAKENIREMYDFDGKHLFTDGEGVYDFFYTLPVLVISGDGPDAAGKTGESAPGNAAESEKAGAENISNGTGLWFTDLLNGNSAFVEGPEYAYSFSTMDGTADLPYFEAFKWDPDYDKGHEWLIDDRLKVREELDGYLGVTRDELTGEWYILVQEGGKAGVRMLDSELREVCRTPSQPSFYDGMKVYVDNKACIAQDSSGKVIFCYPMIGSLGN